MLMQLSGELQPEVKGFHFALTLQNKHCIYPRCFLWHRNKFVYHFSILAHFFPNHFLSVVSTLTRMHVQKRHLVWHSSSFQKFCGKGCVLVRNVASDSAISIAPVQSSFLNGRRRIQFHSRL